jgi:hypothetical protein
MRGEVEVRGRGSGRLRLHVLKDTSGARSVRSSRARPSTGAVAHTHGWNGYNGPRKLGRGHGPRRQAGAQGEQCSHAHPRGLEPQGVDARHPPRRPRPSISRSTSTVRLPSQPAPQMTGFQALLGLGAATSRSPTATSSTEPPDTPLKRTRYALGTCRCLPITQLGFSLSVLRAMLAVASYCTTL